MKYTVKRPVHVDKKRYEIGDTITRKSEEDEAMQSLVDCGHVEILIEPKVPESKGEGQK